MFAQVNSVQMNPGQLTGLVTFCEEQLPGFRGTPGFQGFYLLADPQSDKVISISLWDTETSLRQNNANRGAQVRDEVDSELGVASPPVEIYEVVMQA